MGNNNNNIKNTVTASVFAAELPLLIMMLSVNKLRSSVEFVLYIMICCFITAVNAKRNFLQKANQIFDIQYPVFDILLSFCLAVRFYRRWYAYTVGRGTFDFIPLSLQQTCVILSAFAFAAAVPSLDLMLKSAYSVLKKDCRKNNEAVSAYFFIFVAAFIFITLNSQCSPLYPINNWNDTNIMFTVGKSVLKGFVPYRDYLDQKGPICLFLHTIGAAVSYDSFLGMWILEIVAAFLFLLTAYKTISLYSGRRTVIIFIPVIAMLTYSCVAFEMGDSAEEYCLPLIAYAFYLGMKSLKYDTLPAAREYLILGLTSGCVFWIKYSMLGFYAAWFVFFLVFSIKRKQAVELLNGCRLIAAGVFITSMPVLLYFCLNAAITDLFKGYFYNIIVYYADEYNWTFREKMREGFIIFAKYNFPALILPFLGSLILYVQGKRKEALFTVFVFLSDFIFTYSGGRIIAYYSLIFSVFSISFFCGAVCLIENRVSLSKFIRKYTAAITVSTLSLGIAGLSICSINMMYINADRNDFLAYKLKNVIDEYNIRDPKILHYRTMETGVNTAAGALPPVKHFCSYNMDRLPEQYIEQQQCIESGCADFIVMDADHILSEEEIPVFDLYNHLGFFEGNTRTSPGTFFYHYYIKR